MAYDNGMCAHVWAQQNKESGKSGNGNMSFEGTILYSYRTPIGRFVDTVDGRRAVLVTSETFSVTTSGKHMPALWRAIDYGRGAFAPCFKVPHLCGGSGLGYTHFELTAKEHAANLAHLVERYGAAIASDKRKRDLWGNWQQRHRDNAQAAADYAEAFGLPVPALSPSDDIAEVEQVHAARAAKFNAPGAAERREAEAVKRAERKERKAQEARAKALADAAEAVADWRAGRRRSLPYGVSSDENGGALLRVQMAADIETGQLQTSMGATVPLPDAIRVFRFVKLCKERGEAWHRNGRTLPVGAFQVDHVAPNGTFRAGCHLIHWPEIEAAARAAGVLDIVPADTREGEASHA